MYERQLFARTVACLAVLITATSMAAPAAAADAVLVCGSMHAKAMPSDLRVDAMKFTGPSGDGRRGSAGFVVRADKLLKGDGTRMTFRFHRDVTGYSFQVIHPFQKGHVLVSVHSSISIHRGGSWGGIGWGDPATSDKIQLTAAAKQVLPIKPNKPHDVTSQLTAAGQYRLWIDDKLVCQHVIKKTQPLSLDVPKKTSVWAGSSWDRTPFSGKDFQPKLLPGHTGLILGPMDGSAPRQNFKQIKLSSAR